MVGFTPNGRLVTADVEDEEAMVWFGLCTCVNVINVCTRTLNIVCLFLLHISLYMITCMFFMIAYFIDQTMACVE